ncbi:metal ABC transporter solute-binding protein, Zn/Mn family [Natronorubrum tibetense]|uniref:Metal ABC transporter substrate-binding protein n=1 Tax=Natronorubrum tibetense GA33 TaxID=1114856 RepID=L9VMT1_9EURY|nr:zinc ABC transporter substrate-binding protein [Natronorubrum tibetense]ELY38495.1 metal ABC transporter substrate-binding protein [Natronorubrum tibetense GA33]
MNRTRRSVLQSGAGVLALSTLAGCLSEPDSDTAGGGYAAFFALQDWAEQVAGDEMSFENPIPTGEMGHGEEPPADIQRDIVDGDVFVYLDTVEFDWAQDIAADIETDYDHVTLIDGMAGLESQLLPLGDDDSDGADRQPDEYDDDPADVSVRTFDVYHRPSGTEVAYWHTSADHWHGELPEIPVGGTTAVDGVFEDADGRVLPLGEDEPFQLDARVVDGADEDVLEIESEGDHVVFRGLEIGRTRIVFELVADGEVVWDTSADNMSADVVEDAEPPESYDPHVWVDPVLAGEIVETIADGLAEADPDSAEVYEENAAEYVDRLEAVHQQFDELSANAERDVAVLAGHDSFQYIEHRYGFEIHTAQDISPDAGVTSGDLANTIEIIDDNDIETILYDPFEGDEGALPTDVEHLLENSDAENAEPISPAEGTTQEWEDDGWGWVEQMEELNLPSLRKALGAE